MTRTPARALCRSTRPPRSSSRAVSTPQTSVVSTRRVSSPRFSFKVGIELAADPLGLDQATSTLASTTRLSQSCRSRPHLPVRCPQLTFRFTLQRGPDGSPRGRGGRRRGVLWPGCAVHGDRRDCWVSTTAPRHRVHRLTVRLSYSSGDNIISTNYLYGPFPPLSHPLLSTS